MSRCFSTCAVAERREFELEMRVLCGDGSVIWENGLATSLFNAEGNYSGLLTVVRDITESKRATASLGEQEATYRALFNGIGAGSLGSRPEPE